MSTFLVNGTLNRLTDLAASAREHADRATDLGMPFSASELLKAASAIDATRATLIEDGDDGLDAAWAYLDTATVLVARWAVILDRTDDARMAKRA